MKKEKLLLLISSLLILLVLNGMIGQKEKILRNGRLLYLELAPRDPRSLMQGDYMELRYKIALAPELDQIAELPHQGILVLRTDGRGIGTFVRLQANEPLAEDEMVLTYRRKNQQIRLGAESFFFQAGQADLFQNARYGKLRLDATGTAILIGLTDEKLTDLGLNH